MIQKIHPLSATALLILSACTSDSSSSGPTIPSADSDATCSVKKISDNTVEMVYGVPGISSTTITTTIKDGKAESTIYTKYSSSTPAEFIRRECDENKQEAAEDYGDNASVTCTDGSVTIKSIDNAEGISVEKLYEKAVGECEVFREMYDDNDEGKGEYGDDEYNKEGSDPIESDPPMSNPDDDNIPVADDVSNQGGVTEENPVIVDTPTVPDAGNGNSNGMSTCVVDQNTETVFEMTAVNPDTGTVKILVAYENGIFEETTSITFNENIPESFIQQECEESKSDALEERYDSAVTCEGNVIKAVVSMESPINPLKIFVGEYVEMCNDIQETGVFPDDEI